MGRTREFDEESVLDSALDLFWRRGYEASSMSDLCEAMGLRAGSVYSAFGDKRGLFVRCLRRYAETVSAQALQCIHTGSSGLQGIRTYFANLVDAMVDGRRRWGCLLTNSVVEFAASDPELATIFEVHFSRLETAFAAALARAQAAGELRSGAGPHDAALLVAVVQGMNVLAKTHPGRPTLQRIASEAITGLTAQRS
jgi:TetR/AcrR family transcriptional regulator, transcriptional repressor for nem operon